jgi:uncharacterized protein (DUF1800 family)
MDRREFLAWSGVVAGATALSGCALPLRRLASDRREPTEPFAPNKGREARLLSRATFGWNRESIALIQTIGAESWVGRQLEAGEPEDEVLLGTLSRLEVLHMQAAELQDQPQHEVLRQLQQGALLRAIYSKNQLHEVMVDFWTNHFAIFAKKDYAAWRKPADESRVIRAHALGSFPEMLAASARSPAMLAYLDNEGNTNVGPNENYARELMELHTLGVYGGYTQADVREVARCFTGWGMETRFLRPRQQFRFDASAHDPGPKMVLGHSIPAKGGVRDGERVLEILAAHPQTAKNIATKLCRFFLGDAGDVWIDRTAKTYLETKGDIAAMIRPILLSEEMTTGPALPKRPLEYLTSVLRATECITDAGESVQNQLGAMGQPLYQWPRPDGFPIDVEAWKGGVLLRWNFTSRLASGQLKGAEIPTNGWGVKDPIEWVSIILNRPAEPKRHAIDRVVQGLSTPDPRLAPALCLMSPEFQWK